VRLDLTNVENEVRAICYANAVGVSYPQTPSRQLSQYPDGMKIHDETIEEINEALAHLVDGVRHAEDFRKQHLLELIDQMLDARLTRGNQ
jgi:hypothetical protein